MERSRQGCFNVRTPNVMAGHRHTAHQAALVWASMRMVWEKAIMVGGRPLRGWDGQDAMKRFVLHLHA